MIIIIIKNRIKPQPGPLEIQKDYRKLMKNSDLNFICLEIKKGEEPNAMYVEKYSLENKTY